jgi:hypothetical protein
MSTHVMNPVKKTGPCSSASKDVNSKVFEAPVWPRYSKLMDKFPNFSKFLAQRLAVSNDSRDDRIHKARHESQALGGMRKTKAQPDNPDQ